MQQTQPIFDQDDVQKTYSPFDDPMQQHVEDADKDVQVQKAEPVQAVPALEVQKEEEKKEQEPATEEKPGFWKKFGDKAKGIFG